ARVPPVLLVTSAAARVSPGYRPGLLWTTTEALAVSGPLAAAWRSASCPAGTEEGHPLRTALDRLGMMRPRPTPASLARVATTLAVPNAPDTLRRRATRVRASPSTMPDPHDLLGLPLVLQPRAWPLLRCVGEHPLLSRFDLATAL